MNLVDEEHIVALQIGEQCRQVLGLFEHRAAGLTEIHAQLGGNDVGECGLAQTRRPEQQNMVERLLAFLGSANEDFQLLAHLGLADVLAQLLGAQGAFDRLFAVRDGYCRDHPRRFAGGGRQAEIVGLDAHRLTSLLGQRLERQLDAFAHGHVRGKALERGGGFLFAVTQSDERLLDVTLRIAHGSSG